MIGPKSKHDMNCWLAENLSGLQADSNITGAITAVYTHVWADQSKYGRPIRNHQSTLQSELQQQKVNRRMRSWRNILLVIEIW